MILFKDDIGRGRLALLLLALLLSVFVLSPAAYSRADNLYELEITGDGVSNPMTFTMDQLQDLEVYQQVYSTINTWPTKRFYIARGVRLKQLLDLAGIQDEAKVIKFYSYDGYEVSLTVKELLKDKRYYYPHLMENGGSDGSVAGSSADKEEVDAILAWESAESSTDPEEMNDMNALLLIFGQRAVTEQQSLSKKQLKQLQELIWLEQAYNLILLGPPGVGKTCLSIGLGIEAISRGYRVTFIQMDELIRLLKTEEISRNSRAKVKRMVGSDLVIIDDLMFMAIDRHEANLFFQLINKLYAQTSIIITSNKGPEDWGDILGDPAITTAILDRLIHKSEVIHLTGDSYRMKHRQTIFGNN